MAEAVEANSKTPKINERDTHKLPPGADFVALGKENGFEFTQEELETGWEELQESDEGLTDFELDVVSGGKRGIGGGC